MSKLKSQISVNEEVAKIIQDYYRCTTPIETLAAVCFSQPQLQSHSCNKLAPLEGNQKCTYCNHDPLKLCAYSCEISKACLAAFAYRLGIGGDKIRTAMKKNLEAPYEDLLQMIQDVFAEDVEDKREIDEKPPESVSEPVSTPAPVEDVPKPSGTPTDLVTVRVAADLWGCTPPNLYAHIKRGKLKAYTQGDDKTKLVSKSAVLSIKSGKGE